MSCYDFTKPTTSLIRPLGQVPRVVLILRFYCTCILVCLMPSIIAI